MLKIGLYKLKSLKLPYRARRAKSQSFIFSLWKRYQKALRPHLAICSKIGRNPVFAGLFYPLRPEIDQRTQNHQKQLLLGFGFWPWLRAEIWGPKMAIFAFQGPSPEQPKPLFSLNTRELSWAKRKRNFDQKFGLLSPNWPRRGFSTLASVKWLQKPKIRQNGAGEPFVCSCSKWLKTEVPPFGLEGRFRAVFAQNRFIQVKKP